MMRLSRGSGLTGLAGMRAVSQREGVMILRPLLEMSAQSLIAHCRATRAGFVSDPSNRDPRFERVRVRDALVAMIRQRYGGQCHVGQITSTGARCWRN